MVGGILLHCLEELNIDAETIATIMEVVGGLKSDIVEVDEMVELFKSTSNTCKLETILKLFMDKIMNESEL